LEHHVNRRTQKTADTAIIPIKIALVLFTDLFISQFGYYRKINFQWLLFQTWVAVVEFFIDMAPVAKWLVRRFAATAKRNPIACLIPLAIGTFYLYPSLHPNRPAGMLPRVLD